MANPTRLRELRDQAAQAYGREEEDLLPEVKEIVAERSESAALRDKEAANLEEAALRRIRRHQQHRLWRSNLENFEGNRIADRVERRTGVSLAEDRTAPTDEVDTPGVGDRTTQLKALIAKLRAGHQLSIEEKVLLESVVGAEQGH